LRGFSFGFLLGEIQTRLATHIVGKAPTPIHAFWAQHHPTVAELQERYVLKTGQYERSGLSCPRPIEIY
jgi:hypothetical protein